VCGKGAVAEGRHSNVMVQRDGGTTWPINIAMNESLLVRVDAHVRSNLFHHRLPSLRLWRPRALTRDWVASTTVLSAAKHYNVTMASR
jgi:hypothetical protein